MAGQQSRQPQWHRLDIRRVEDLADAVHGAGMEATQMSRGKLGGSIVFAQDGDITYTGGLIDGRVALRGPLSPDTLSLGVALDIPSQCWHWLTEVKTGTVGVYHGADEHDSLYSPGCHYAVATISMDRLEEMAARFDLVLDRTVLGGTGLHGRSMSPSTVKALASEFERLHVGHRSRPDIGPMLLQALINHLARPPIDHARRINTHLHAKIVMRARSYIIEHLAEPIALDDIAAAAIVSRRTLYRAFAEIFDDTPQGYVRRLRLHRIRQGLASPNETACTIAVVANQWGISELGRLAGWYRQMFGELPSDTLAAMRHAHPGGTRH